MKNKLIHLFYGMFGLVAQEAICQSIPMFEMPVYFEDAVGNKDTVIVGYDPTANSYNLNPQFGEEWVEGPFDSVFEVRAIHFDDGFRRTSKKIIESFESAVGDSCGAGGSAKIMLNAKYFPITITYDTALIHAGGCHLNMILSPDWQIFLQQYWWDARVFYCMSNYDRIIDSSGYLVHPENHASYLKYEFEVEGQGMKELPGYFWVVKWIGICQTIVGSNEAAAPASGLVFPNPANDWVRLKLPDQETAERIDFHDNTGRKFKSLNTPDQSELERIDIAGLPVGFYMVSAWFKERAPILYRFVKH